MTRPICSRTAAKRWPSASISAARSAPELPTGRRLSGLLTNSTPLANKGRYVMDEAEARERGLARIEAAAAVPRSGSAPRDCGHFDIHIDRNGSWFYRGTPINRASLVRLFGTMLEQDETGQYWLTTPAERGRITVDDAPFLALELERVDEGRDQVLIFRTNVGDFVTLDAA